MSTPTPPPESDLDVFVKLSAALTGIDAAKLNPRFDPYDLATTYSNLARTQDGKNGETYAQLLALYRANESKPPDDIAKIVLSHAPVKFLAQSVMLLWLLAAWFDPLVLADPSTKTAPFGPPNVVVSADAYTQSFVWKVAQTHPMGYSEWSFGYWTQNPPPLSAFIGGSTS